MSGRILADLQLTLDLKSKDLPSRPPSTLSMISSFFKFRPLPSPSTTAQIAPIPVPSRRTKKGINFSRPLRRISVSTTASRTSGKSGRSNKSKSTLGRLSQFINIPGFPPLPSENNVESGEMQEMRQRDNNGLNWMGWSEDDKSRDLAGIGNGGRYEEGGGFGKRENERDEDEEGDEGRRGMEWVKTIFDPDAEDLPSAVIAATVNSVGMGGLRPPPRQNSPPSTLYHDPRETRRNQVEAKEKEKEREKRNSLNSQSNIRQLTPPKPHQIESYSTSSTGESSKKRLSKEKQNLNKKTHRPPDLSLSKDALNPSLWMDDDVLALANTPTATVEVSHFSPETTRSSFSSVMVPVMAYSQPGKRKSREIHEDVYGGLAREQSMKLSSKNTKASQGRSEDTYFRKSDDTGINGTGISRSSDSSNGRLERSESSVSGMADVATLGKSVTGSWRSVSTEVSKKDNTSNETGRSMTNIGENEKWSKSRSAVTPVLPNIPIAGGSLMSGDWPSS
ncbi:hypothetical protein M231_00909 [Tremella mesenterica]|uniref:Uncharacterized protein n=1 Tax=Tremella mesenterica TaxID=5217 RepID=A0A4Q1BU95_TREME|nr:hypothetical protein M231_00909 [Tremella mesenterica]